MMVRVEQHEQESGRGDRGIRSEGSRIFVPHQAGGGTTAHLLCFHRFAFLGTSEKGGLDETNEASSSSKSWAARSAEASYRTRRSLTRSAADVELITICSRGVSVMEEATAAQDAAGSGTKLLREEQ